MKKKSILTSSFSLVLSLFLCSCGGEFGATYRSTTPYRVSGPASSYPPISKTSSGSHTSRVRSYERKGYAPIGESTILRRYNLNEDHARQLVQAKKGDAGVMSSKYLGTRTERVAVPVSTTTYNSRAAAASAYGNNYGYRSAQVAQAAKKSEATTYVYQNQKYKLWRHKATVLARKNRLTQ